MCRTQVFEQLRKPIDPKVVEQREKEINDRIYASYEKAEKRQNELISLNSTAPVTISSIRVLNANHTRHGFLEHIFHPVLTQNRQNEEYYTLREALTEVSKAVDKLNRLDIFQQPISTYVDKAEQTDPSTTPTDHAVFVSVKERGRYTIKTGTEAGSSEGSAYLNVTLRNIFGGAERLNGHASLGTRTRETYSATFDTPILANPDLRWEIGGMKSSTVKPWASHEEILRGGQSRLLWQTSPFTKHDFTYSGFWRQITGLAEKASPTVRADAGDSFKSSISHTFTHDTRDIPMLPSRGVLFKTVSELAGGFGQYKGDVAFAKLQFESQAAVPIPIPGVKGDSGVSFTAGLRGGLLAPLPLSGDGYPVQSRINDRFQLGGPTDVRGFRLSGLGPRDGQDAVGGDVFAAGGASLLFPLPRTGKDTPLRLQAFINGGRLLSLRDTRKKGDDSPMTMGDVTNGLTRTVQDLTNSLPSTAAGFGIVYAHPAARVEVNFSLPLVVRKGEEGRKGLSFGIGLDFL